MSEYYQGLQADIAVERGVAYTGQKMYSLAIDAYARALDFDPRRAVIHRRLAELLIRRWQTWPAPLFIRRKRTSSRKASQK